MPGASAGRRTVLVPIAAGFIAVALVVGTVRFSGSVAWWVPAAVLSAAPIITIAALRPSTSHRTGRRARSVLR